MVEDVGVGAAGAVAGVVTGAAEVAEAEAAGAAAGAEDVEDVVAEVRTGPPVFDGPRLGVGVLDRMLGELVWDSGDGGLKD